MIGLNLYAYEDELAYSVFARYHSKSGYICYSSSAEDLFVNSKINPNIEFCNLLTNDALEHIGSIERFINNHTMLPYYKFTLSFDRQQIASELACSMNVKELVNVLPLQKSKVTRYLRYCPLCAIDDRKRYGETYWHRTHQVYGVTTCQKHGCKLIDSNVRISSSNAPSVITAESQIKNIDNIATETLSLECDIAKYIAEIIKSNISSQTSVSEYLNGRLLTTQYCSVRGAKRYIQVLSNDFKSYYKDIDLLGFGEAWQIEKILNGYRYNPFEISLLAMFLGVQARELVKREKAFVTRNTSDFDSSIQRLKSGGLNYREVAATLGISYDYCKVLAYGKKSKKAKPTNRNGGRKVDWELLDNNTLSKVVELVDKMNDYKTNRPQKVSIGKVERLLGLKECQLNKMPRCLEYVRAHIIIQEEFWAKTIAWAILELEKQNKPIHITNIMRLTNIRKENIIKAVPFFKGYTNISECSSCNNTLGLSEYVLNK